MKKSVILIILVMTLLTSVQAREKKLKLRKTAKAMKQEIAKQVAIGSSIKDAQRILEAGGFDCSLYERGKFKEDNGSEYEIEHTNVDFLYCGKDKFLWTLRRPWEALFYTRRWEVEIVHKDGLVSEIFVSIWRYSEL
jgi:hypothetical protein